MEKYRSLWHSQNQLRKWVDVWWAKMILKLLLLLLLLNVFWRKSTISNHNPKPNKVVTFYPKKKMWSPPSTSRSSVVSYILLIFWPKKKHLPLKCVLFYYPTFYILNLLYKWISNFEGVKFWHSYLIFFGFLYSTWLLMNKLMLNC